MTLNQQIILLYNSFSLLNIVINRLWRGGVSIAFLRLSTGAVISGRMPCDPEYDLYGYDMYEYGLWDMYEFDVDGPNVYEYDVIEYDTYENDVYKYGVYEFDVND